MGWATWRTLIQALSVVLMLAFLKRAAWAGDGLEIESVGFLPHETAAQGAPGHWWEVRLGLNGRFPYRVEGELVTAVSAGTPTASNTVTTPLYSVRRSFSYQGPGRRSVRIPVFWGGNAHLSLNTRLRDRDGQILTQDLTTARKGPPCVISVVSAEPAALTGLTADLRQHGPSHADLYDSYRLAVPLERVNVPFPGRVLVRRVRSLPLPQHPLCWSAISHVIWLDVPASALTLDQVESLKLWLHWGGTLVLSGGQHAKKWEGDPLDEFLPASFGEACDIVFDSASAEPPIRLVGWELMPRSSETVLLRSPRGQPYAAEWRLGHGRVVQVAFALTDRWFENCKSWAECWERILLGEDPDRTGPTGVRIFARDLGRSTPKNAGAFDAGGAAVQVLLEHIYKACSSTRLWATRWSLGLILGAYLLFVAIAHGVAIRRRTAVNWCLLPLISVACVLGTAAYVTNSKGGYAEIELAETFVDLPYVRRTELIGFVSQTHGEAEIRAAKPGVLLLPLDMLRTRGEADTVFPRHLAELTLQPLALKLNLYPIIPRATLAEAYEPCDVALFAAAEGATVRNNAPMELRDVVLVGGARCELLARAWPTGETLALRDVGAAATPDLPDDSRGHETCAVAGDVVDPVYRDVLDLAHESYLLPRPFLLAWSDRTEPIVKGYDRGRAGLVRTIWCIFMSGTAQDVGAGK